MAKLDQLIEQVEDEALRDDLVEAAKEIRKQQTFGLVFEEHIPETTLLRDFPIRPGMVVYRRDDIRAREPLEVLSVNRTRAKVQANPNGKTQSMALDELLVYKRFGEPIYPALTPVGQVAKGAHKPHHAVINGENYHALQLLMYLYDGKADCIYVDPPYNTGARDWKYNNRFVDENDTWRHSKWLSMMEKRLRLAKRLLKDDGVLIVTIDEHEVHHLGCLLETSGLFGAYNRQMVSIVINPKGVTQGGLSRVEEYAYFCHPDGVVLQGRGEDLLTHGKGIEDEVPIEAGKAPRWQGLLHSGEGASREDRRTMFYPVLIDEERGAVIGAGEPLLPKATKDGGLPPVEKWPVPNLDAKVDGHTAVWPVRKDGSWGRWYVGHETLREFASKGYVRLGKYDPKRKTWALQYLYRQLREQVDAGLLEVAGYDKKRNVVDVRYVDVGSRRIKTVWHRSRHDAGAYGADLLGEFLGARLFPFPKSLYAVRDCLAAVVGQRPEALVIDFFAGSGTTLHATALLNDEDDGARRCVLVTNNEVSYGDERKLNKAGHYQGDPEFEAHGIFEQVTRPRCEALVTGKRPDGKPVRGAYPNGREMSAGFEENVDFFRMDYLDPDEVELGRQFQAILPALWLTAGGHGNRPSGTGREAYVIPDDARFGVLIRESAFRKFAAELEGRDDVTHVWLITDSERAFADMRAALPGSYEVSMLYRDYLRNFAINTVRA